jgi:hypothetical protein
VWNDDKGTTTTYTGGANDDYLNGKGKCEFSENNSNVEGVFIEGELDGKAYEEITSKHKYEGQFRKGHKHGQGKLTWYDGSWY